MTNSMVAVLVIAVLGLGACGTAVPKASSTSSGGAWVAGHLPDGFVIVTARERDGRRTVGYRPASQRGGVDYQIAITASAPAASLPAPGPAARTVKVRGHDATVATLSDEGNEYGVLVQWDERSDLRLVVEGSNGPTEQQTLAVAADVHTISEAAWKTLLVELAPAGRVDPHARPVVAARGTVGGAEYTLTALVPGGFPLGPDDRRADCFNLTFAGAKTADFCATNAIWARVAGQAFVFGAVDADVRMVRVTDLSGSTFEPFTVATATPPSGPRTAFYVAPLPQDACSVSVDHADGIRGPGPTGPLPGSGADYVRCVGLAAGQRPSLPTTVTTTPGLSG